MIKIIESLNKESLTILTPWKMVATYEKHPEEIEFYDSTEEDCMNKIADAQTKYGKCTWYSGCNDEYYVDGEYVEPTDNLYESNTEDYRNENKIVELISILSKASNILDDKELKDFINEQSNNNWNIPQDINDYIETLKNIVF